MIVHDPKNSVDRIDTIYAFISSDETGEGVCGMPLPNGSGILPMIAADEKRLESLRPIAQMLASFTKKKIKLIKLSVREDLETIEPQEEQHEGEESSVQGT